MISLGRLLNQLGYKKTPTNVRKLLQVILDSNVSVWVKIPERTGPLQTLDTRNESRGIPSGIERPTHWVVPRGTIVRLAGNDSSMVHIGRSENGWLSKNGVSKPVNPSAPKIWATSDPFEVELVRLYVLKKHVDVFMVYQVDMLI